MKKFVTLLFAFLLLGIYQQSKAQCVIDSTDTVVGITPDTTPCIMRGQAFGYAYQVHIPASTTFGPFAVTIDSVQLDSITGLPSGVNVTGTPSNGIIPGNGNGCLWISGNTNAAIGSYSPTFYLTVWYNSSFGGPGVADTTLADLGYNFTINICGPPVPVAGFYGTPQSGCAGSVTVSFTDTSSLNPTSWNWTFAGGAPPTSSQQNPIVTFSSVGAHAVTLVATNANGSDTITSAGYINVYGAGPSVTMQATPASTHTTANGTATAFALGGSQPYTYLWSNGATTAIDSNLLPGVYRVTVSDTHNCPGVDSITVTYLTGIEPLTNTMVVKIYPDPAYDYLNLAWSSKPDAEIAISDLSGKVIKRLVATGGNISTLDIHDLASGIYVISITDRQTMQVQSARFTKF
jgi:PKD repeat protein